MTNTLLNISGKLDSRIVALYQRVSKASSLLNIPFIVVGASARDLVLHYGYGAPIRRATADIDLAVQIPDWAAYEVIRKHLVGEGFTETRMLHRLISAEKVPLDIVPFGEIEDEDANIHWPPDGGVTMNVLGFQDAYDHASAVRIQEDPVIDIPVATPPGMALLKLIAWTDRSADMRRKDAQDLRYLLSTYAQIPRIESELYKNESLLSAYEWDVDLLSAYQLGCDVKAIASNKTHETLIEFFQTNDKPLSVEKLVEEMCGNVERLYVQNEKLTNAFFEGYFSSLG